MSIERQNIYDIQSQFVNQSASNATSSNIEHQEEVSDLHLLQEKVRDCAQATIIAVGAGPANLMALYNLQCLDPSLKIVVLEMRDEYTRTHGLTLSRNCFKNAVSDPALDNVLEKFYKKIDEGRSIPSQEIESSLKKLCEEKNITFIRGVKFEHQPLVDSEHTPASSSTTPLRIHGLDHLKKLFPQSKVIIGGDGAHSEVRKALYGEELNHSKVLQHTVFVRCLLSEPPKKMNNIATAYKAMKIAERVVVEHTSSKAKDGKFELVLHMFVPEEEYSPLKASSTWKQPKDLESPEVHPNLKACVKTWLNTRHMLNPEQIEKVSVIPVPLATYASPGFVKEIDDQTIVTLVGDAAFGVPYNKSCQNGIECAIELAKTIHKSLLESSIGLKKPEFWAQYNSFVEKFAEKQIKEASIKSMGIELGNASIQAASQSFLQFTVMSSDEKNAIQTGPMPTELPQRGNLGKTIEKAWIKVIETVKMFFWKK